MALSYLPEWLLSARNWEVLAVLLAITYLLLAVRENLLCWYAAFVSSAIYVVLFWDVSLLMQSLLSVYYVVMAVYGWWHWKFGGRQATELPISRWRWRQHLTAIGCVLVLGLVSGYWLERHTAAAWPYADSLVSWGSVIATWMVARKVLENWLYWIVIDVASMLLYAERGLYLTALLFLVYTVIAVFGFFTWRRHLRSQPHAVPT